MVSNTDQYIYTPVSLNRFGEYKVSIEIWEYIKLCDILKLFRVKANTLSHVSKQRTSNTVQKWYIHTTGSSYVKV